MVKKQDYETHVLVSASKGTSRSWGKGLGGVLLRHIKPVPMWRIPCADSAHSGSAVCGSGHASPSKLARTRTMLSQTEMFLILVRS